MIKGACLYNPACDLVLMMDISIIPDWCVWNGLRKEYSLYISKEERDRLYKVSPCSAVD